jgi:hypothetical protein
MGSRRMLLGISGHGAVDEGTMRPRQSLVPDAQSFGHTWTKIFDDDVSCAYDRCRVRTPGPGLEIEHDGALATVPHSEAGIGPARVTSWSFDLDDVSALVRQQRTGQGTRHILTELDDAHSTQRTSGWAPASLLVRIHHRASH